MFFELSEWVNMTRRKRRRWRWRREMAHNLYHICEKGGREGGHMASRSLMF
jgi:hypothetical protein